MNQTGTNAINRGQLEEYLCKKAELKELEYKLKSSGSVNGKGYINNLEQLREECRAIEEFIESLSESQIRRIFRMKYMEGMSLFLIGNKMHLDKSTVSRKISGFFKVATHATMAAL